MASPSYILALMLSVCVSCAALLDRWRQQSPTEANQQASAIAILMGDSQRMFANQFFAKADAYFHNGYYPSIFDSARPSEHSHMEHASSEKSADAHEHGEDHHEGNEHDHPGHEEEENFLGPPRDWIDRFGRNFFPSQHSHLHANNERELLPWLKLSAELDPHKIQTYTVASFWLRNRLGKANEAEQFLRDGQRANPDSYEILFELGRIYDENRHDPDHARSLYELALQKWQKRESSGGHPEEFDYREILLFLIRVDEETGHYQDAIHYAEMYKPVAPSKELVDQQIRELQAKLATGTNSLHR